MTPYYVLPRLKTVSAEHLILHDLRIYQIIITITKHKNYCHHYYHNDYYCKPKTIIIIPQLNTITNYVLLITSHPQLNLTIPWQQSIIVWFTIKNAELQATQKKAAMTYTKLLAGTCLNDLRRNIKASVSVVGPRT